MAALNITNEWASYQAIFALDILTAASALILLGLASRPTYQRLKARRFSSPAKRPSARDTPLKTPLGTYLFLWPALLCLFIAYLTRFISDLLKTAGTIVYAEDLGWSGRTAYDVSGSGYEDSISALSFTSALATVFFTVLLNGGVWIHSSHVQENGTGISTPRTKSKIWNAIVMLAMLASGVAAWGKGMSVRDVSTGSLGDGSLLSWSNVLHGDQTTRIIWVVHESIVVVASLSVTIEVIGEYGTTNKNAHGSPERIDLARFAFVVVPLIWLRDIFIVYDIILLYVSTAGWSAAPVLATTFLLVIFRQFANLLILGMVLWGAWRMGRSVDLFGNWP